MRRAARTDANHRAIKRALEQCGWYVIDTHTLPGFVDLVAKHAAWGLKLIEVKTAKGTLTPAQENLRSHGWPVVILRSVEDAAALR